MTAPDGPPERTDSQLALEIEAFELDRALAPVREELLRRHPRWVSRGPRPADLTAEDLRLYNAAVSPFSAAAQKLWFDTIRRGANTTDRHLSGNVAHGIARLARQNWAALTATERAEYQLSARAMLGLGAPIDNTTGGTHSSAGGCER